MLKQVNLNNVNTGRSAQILVETDSDDKAIIGAGKAPNETAKVTHLAGLDASIKKFTAKGPNLADRANLFSGVARCLERNIPAIKSFELQANRVKSPRYRGIIAEVSHQISIGEKISDALDKFPSEFGSEVVALIRAGEESGRLPEVFQQIGNSQKKTLRILSKLKKGLIYPGIVITMGIGVIILMSYTLVPAVSKLYKDLGAELPFASTMMMKISEVLINKPWVLLFPFIGAYILIKNWGKITRNTGVQKFFAALPAVGGIVRKSAAAISFRTFSLLVEAGVRMNTSLDITSQVAPHIYYKEFFRNIRQHVNEGLGLYESFLMESHWLGSDGRTVCGIMEIASETGSSTEMLNEIADDYEDDLDTTANQIDKIMEPITIVCLGVMVGFLIYAIYSPIFQLGDVMLPGD
ncbi:MAG: type II secretion system F family protein, partial [Verrucomicrobiota bacterium]